MFLDRITPPKLYRNVQRSKVIVFFHFQECRLEPVPNQPGFYKNLDAFGGTQMPCAVGTVFNPLKCQCEQDDNNLLLKAPPLGMQVVAIMLC